MKQVGEILELQTPLLIEGKIGDNVSNELGQPSYDQLIHYFQKQSLKRYVNHLPT